MEPIFEQSLFLDGSRVDCFGRMRLSQILFSIQEVSGAHSAALAAGSDALEKKRLFWAVTRHRVQITRLPRMGETIRVETWPMPATRVAYPRSTVAYDESGNECFRAISLWVLMDADTRKMILPGKSQVVVPGSIRGGELAVPGALVPKTLSGFQRRKVCFSDIDRNGHMNNTRYLDWMADLLPSSFHRGSLPKELIICYHAEAREGQIIEMRYGTDVTGAVQVDGVRSYDGDSGRIFSAKVIYG